MTPKMPPKADRIFLLYATLLVLFGLILLTSAAAAVGYEKFGDTYYFIKRQMATGVIPGFLLFFVFGHISINNLKKWSLVIYLMSVILLVLVFIPPIGITLNNARSWIGLGSYTFQPSELAKLAIIIVLAKFLTDPNRDLSNWQNGLFPVICTLALPLLLIAAQPDAGTLSIIAVIIFTMFFLGEVPRKYIMVLGVVAVVAFAALFFVAPYRVQRLTTFLHPELDPKGIGYQINQSFLAIGSGGFWGLGLGHSRQKFQYLPEVQADSIFAIIAEETGFFFSAVLVILILLMGLRILRIAKNTPDKFGKLAAGGVAVWFVWQSFLNIGSMVGILPLTGVPLPFVSHGGSALMVGLAAVGVVASVSKTAG